MIREKQEGPRVWMRSKDLRRRLDDRLEMERIHEVDMDRPRRIYMKVMLRLSEMPEVKAVLEHDSIRNFNFNQSQVLLDMQSLTYEVLSDCFIMEKSDALLGIEQLIEMAEISPENRILLAEKNITHLQEAASGEDLKMRMRYLVDMIRTRHQTYEMARLLKSRFDLAALDGPEKSWVDPPNVPMRPTTIFKPQEEDPPPPAPSAGVWMAGYIILIGLFMIMWMIIDGKF